MFTMTRQKWLTNTEKISLSREKRVDKQIYSSLSLKAKKLLLSW